MIRLARLSLLFGSFAVMQASATPILVGTWNFTGGGSAVEYATAVSAIAAYNAANDPDLPALETTSNLALQVGAGGYTVAGDDKTLVWTAPGTYDFYYVLAKFGATASSLDTALHYLLAGDVLSYNPTFANGLSHVSVWGGDVPVWVPQGGGTVARVPDGGNSVAIVGGMLAALVLLRRRR